MSIHTSKRATEDAPWQLIGKSRVLREKKCRRLFAQKGREHDIALFYKSGKFYAMSAWCAHMGGPLHAGDIEDHNGSSHVMCPWHGYMFDLKTGMNEIGISQEVFEVKEEDDIVYIRSKSELTLTPMPPIL